MPGSTDRQIVFPVNGDVMEPLAGWFATLAASVNDAIDEIYDGLAVPELPLPQYVASPGAQVITTTGWADHPGLASIALDLPRPCIASIVVQGWVNGQPNADSRLSASISGATVLSEAQMEVGGPGNQLGAIVIQPAGGGLTQGSATRTVRLNPGENTFKLRVMKSGTGNGEVRYATMQVTPIRWA